LHLVVAESSSIQKNCQWIALQLLCREDIDLHKPKLPEAALSDFFLR
jgi:hypothetical protein